MPRVEDIAFYIETIAPTSLAEEWDNVGALVDCGGEITSVLVALDITEDVVLEAQAMGCQLIVAHHPVIFKPLHRVSKTDIVYRLIKKNISAVCAHTNMDAAVGGVSETLAHIFRIEEMKSFSGCGRVGTLKMATTTAQLAALCKEKFKSSVQFCDTGRQITTLAVIGGAGGSLFVEAAGMGADCLLTGEVSHHEALDAKKLGLSTISAGHFSTEYPLLPVLAEKLSKHFPELRVLVSRRGTNPFTTI